MKLTKESGGDSGNGNVISIVGPGMRVIGDMETEGTVRVEGVVEGNIRAGKAVVLGKEGTVRGEIHTEDAVLSGRLEGNVTAASRLEVQESARIDGDIHARRIQLQEGAVLNGTVQMEDEVSLSRTGGGRSPAGDPESPEARDAEPDPEPVS